MSLRPCEASADVRPLSRLRGRVREGACGRPSRSGGRWSDATRSITSETCARGKPPPHPSPASGEGGARSRGLREITSAVTMAARALMFQGTGSDVGKSLIVAGLARAFADRGLAVRPFKPQNMSNNAAVTADGGEIGRAQALQARAARVAPSVHMNPVLLKPQSEIGAQIVVQGRVLGTAKAARLPGDEAGADAGRARELREAAGRGRPRAGRGRRQRLGDQSARERHRQHGLRPRRRRAGRAGRRHRPRRRDREPRRHQGGDRRRRRRADPRLHRQQVSRRSRAVRRRHDVHRGAHRLGRARPRAVLSRRAAAAGRGRAGARPRAARASRARGCASPCRSCRTSPISTISIRSTPSPRSRWCWCGPAARCRATPTS